MFSSLQARMMRTAISPRFAIRIFSNMWPICFGRRGKGGGRWFPALRRRSSWSNLEQGLPDLNGLAVFARNWGNNALNFGLNLVIAFIPSVVETTGSRVSSGPVLTVGAGFGGGGR